ncbi:MAG: S8 family serine peptidase [Desulfosporosinus sp.]
MKRKNCAAILSIIVLLWMTFGALTVIPLNPVVAQTEVAQQVVVELNGVTPETLADQIGAKVGQKGPLNFATLALAPGKNPDEVIGKLKTLAGVLGAERNRVRKITAVQVNEPYYAKQYNLALANIPKAWSSGATGQGMTIAIVDTGVDLNHPDLKGNLVSGYNAITDSGGSGAGQDNNGHGTSVAGIAAAQLNGVGVVGVAYAAKIMPIKVMDNTGEGADDIIAQGIVWAAEHGANIINLSLGSDTKTAVLGEAIKYARNKGALIFAAAGNYDPATQSNPGISYPASDPNVISVAAADEADKIDDFSAFGPEIVLSAPGSKILSDYWTKAGSTYAYADGTSMASPFAAGVAALIWSKHPDWTADQVRLALEKGAKDLGSPGRDEQYGYGRVDADQSLHIMDAAQSLSSPAKVPTVGALVQGREDTMAKLLVPAQAFAQDMTVGLSKVTSPGSFPIGIVSGGTTVKVDFAGIPRKILTLTVEGQTPPGDSAHLGYVYRWSGSRWILVGGGVASTQVKVGIYEPGIYQVGYTQVPETSRLAGLNRQETAIEVAKAAYPAGTDTVILAREDDFPDALTSAPLAYKEHAPILLTNPQSLSPKVLAEINRLEPQKVILLGSTAAISEQVQNQLSSLGYTVNRIWGPNRYATAAAIAKELGTSGKAIVVNGDNFPDALVIASPAAQNGEPILLTASSALAPETDEVLRQLSVTETLVIGAEVRVSDPVLEQLPGHRRIAGPNRYGTAAYVLSEYPPPGQGVYLATGEDFPDALSGGLLAAIQGTNVVLVPPDGLPPALLDVLRSWQGRTVIALGGPNVVPERELHALQELFD